MSYLDEDQEIVDEVTDFEMHHDGIVEYVITIVIMNFPDEFIRTSKKTRQIVPLCNMVRGPIEPAVQQLELRAASYNLNDAPDAFNMYEANEHV
jgi:hypothetical protein